MSQAQARIHHAINWFEIPVADMARAIAFYQTLLGVTLRHEHFAGSELAIFPADEQQGVKGALMKVDKVRPGDNGVIVYLNAGPSLDAVLARLEQAGGKLALPPVTLPDGIGRFAHITDPDGQRVGLHALD